MLTVHADHVRTPVDVSVNEFRQVPHHTRSHSFASGFGSVSAAVTIMILPSLATSIRAISTPPAIAARMARVTSFCRNVEGARAMMTTAKSLQIVHAVAHRAERRLVVPAVGGWRVETPALAMQPNQLATDGKLLLQPVWGHPAALRADVAGRHSDRGNFLVRARVSTISPILKRASVQTRMAVGQVAV